jgi:hypothetical protein
MDKKLTGLVAAAAAAAPIAAAEAATPQELTQTMTVRSYADLLTPIANAPALLKTSDEFADRARAASEDRIRLAQWGDPDYYYRHHHHHHNNYWRRRRWRHHHHHHHHHHDYYRPRYYYPY